ncbi:hypothetical protein SAMN05192534_10742 [Alteribacillus persepolensis]|uniref:Uncharacterized protein n=1 Tax=Alteribacillus persepolensis TaxID=568899 RepID=A0A1G8DD86_9BACI|nr:hypothetical protein [Alteribacillus persepolensis]SDH55379.1 hypothetical protein SAMN05192534_10742 [Alteribacillus persepolensis]
MDKLQKGQTDKENYSMDVDRMINEGLAGGTIHSKYSKHNQLDQARDLDKEEPPSHN